ncbi:type VII secretion protein EccB [Nocardia beijingensis]|uniref:type VII secretion protein EccB n=1 Tax=Nocardia beijingensis TaxID=95162 RepID=UPI00332ABDFD
MSAQLTTRAQVNGYLFLLRRLDHALVRRDVRMLHDPMRSQSRSLLTGAVLGLLGVAGCAILAFLHPQGAIGDANIIMGKDSGALYVVIPDAQNHHTLHPVLNLASARLITGNNAFPTSVKDAKLGSVPRGPLLGIPGAPAALPGSAQRTRSDWTLCDEVALSATGSAAGATSATMTVLAGRPALDGHIRATTHAEAMLVQRGDRTYLVYDGKRAEVDQHNMVMSRVLRLGAQRPRPATTGLLDAAAEAPALTPPQIADAGQPGPGRLSTVPVGGVIAVAGVTGSDRPDLYVVLSNGVQPVSAFAAQVIRNADSHGMNEIKTVPPDVLDNMPIVHSLPIDQFPIDTPKILSAEEAPIVCVSWSKGLGTVQGASGNPSDRSTVTLLAGSKLPLPDSVKPVTMAGRGAGDHVDAAYIPPSTGEFVQVTGMGGDSIRRESLFYVADNGIRYGIADLATATMLGLEKTPRLAPWAIIGQLVPGPVLSKQDALVSYDTLPQPH